jgi:hypothetical protein
MCETYYNCNMASTRTVTLVTATEVEDRRVEAPDWPAYTWTQTKDADAPET